MKEAKTSEKRSNEIPLPIQSFLWRQTDPFVRLRSKLLPASCITLEHVLVDNKLLHLPPSLLSAVGSITRWQFINACLPHVMHCSALLLANRNGLGHGDKFGPAPIKLLKTLHWIFLKASKVCSMEDRNNNCTISMENIRLFVFLFAPIINNIKESDLTFSLEGGQQIWNPMRNNEQPSVEPFIATITPSRQQSSEFAPNCSSYFDSLKDPDVKPIQVTVCDVAVISCLLYQRWAEEGVLWGITYILKKLKACRKQDKDDDDITKASVRRCRSLMTRRKTGLNLKSIHVLPVQKESIKEPNGEDDSMDDIKLLEIIAHPKIQRKLSPFNRFRVYCRVTRHFYQQRQLIIATRQNRASKDIKKPTGKSPIARRKSRKRTFASLSLHKFKSPTTSVAAPKRLSCRTTRTPKEDDPPSYSAVTSGDLGFYSKSTLRKKWFSIHRKSKLSSSATTQDESLSAPPPKYRSSISGCEVEAEVTYNLDSPSGMDSLLQGTDADDFDSATLSANRLWTSDICLTYKPSEHETTTILSCEYIDGDGCLRVDAILSVVDVIVRKSPGLKILDICIQVLVCLHERHEATKGQKKSTSSNVESDDSEKVRNVEMFLRILSKLSQQLGCTNACSKSGHRTNAVNKMREMTHRLITSIFALHQALFIKHLKSIFKAHSLKEIMDVLHSLLSYCVVETNSVAVREINDETLCADHETNTALEDIVVKTVFRPLVAKCIQIHESLLEPENEDLYKEVRNFVQFVRLNHVSTFNWVLLSVMLIPQKKRENWEAEKKKKRDEVAKKKEKLPQSFNRCRRGAVHLGSTPLLSPKIGDKSGKQNLKKFEEIGHLGPSEKKHLLFEQDYSDEEEVDGGRGHRDRAPTTFGKMGNLLKRTSVIPNFNKTDENMEGNESDDYENGNPGLFGKMMKKRNTKRQERSGLASAFEFPFVMPLMELADPLKGPKKNEDFEVDEKDICNGIRILQFLMECCPPGTVPDANVLGSVMGLTSPIISRFVVLLQCAQFVDRCVGDKWPNWTHRRYSQPHRNVKNAMEVYYVTARLQFLRWGTELNKILEKVMSINNHPNTVLGDVITQEEKVRHRNEDLNEDFLKDIRVNQSGKDCPIVLQMAAANLLHQITAFLRETNMDAMYRKESFVTNTDIGSKSEVGTAATTPVRLDESPSKKTIKFFEPSDALNVSSVNIPTLVRTTSLVDEKRPCDRDKTCGRRSSGPYSTTDEKPFSKLSNQRGSRKQSMNTSGNMLTVPGNVCCPTESSIYIPFGEMSYGSTMSLSAASATSEYMPGQKDSNDTPSLYGSSLVIDCLPRGRDLPWLKIIERSRTLSNLSLNRNTIMQLANQQNFLCDHLNFCHPFCHKRILRSCDRMVVTVSKILSKHEKIETMNSEIMEEKKTSFPLYTYLKTKANCLSRSPLLVLLKSISSLSCEMLIDLYALCWELLLDSNKPLVESAASLFLLCAIKIKLDVCKSFINELKHPDPAHRISALKKVRVLWEHRNSVWKNTETQARDNKDAGFTFPAANTSFALSPSSLGLESTPLPDPPWIPHTIDVDQIVAQRGTTVQSAAILSSDKLSYHREKELKQLIRQEEEERAEARKNFHFTNIPVIQQIVIEAKKRNETEPDCDNPCDIRRYSSRPAQTGSSLVTGDSRKEDTRSNRSSIIHGVRSVHPDASFTDNVSRPNSCVFPPAIGDCVPTVIQLILDAATTKDGESVSSVAKSVATSCLNEDSNLFVRSLAEKLICQEEKDDERFKALWIIRNLPTFLPDLSPNVAHLLFVQIMESVVQYNRSSAISEPIVIPSTFAFCAVLPLSKAFDFKIIKQVLRKQQIEMQLLVTAGMQGTKQLSVWSEDHPCNFAYPIQVADYSTFEHVLTEGAKSLEIPESERPLQQMEDPNTKLILCHHCYVRDFYTCRKNATPQISFVRLGQEEAVCRLSRRVVQMKQAEIGRLRLTLEGLRSHENAIDKELNATFIQAEFNKLWSFPRKAMDAEFYLFDSKYGNEIRNLDVIQKYYWIELISEILLSLSSQSSWENNLMFFLHAWSAALVIHCEQAPILRVFSAAIINVLVHYSHTFTLHGYSLVLPAMLKVYSKHNSNTTIRACLDLVFAQMFNVHRQPFLLQLFASAAPLLSEYNINVLFERTEEEDHLSPESFFRLLSSLTDPKTFDELYVLSDVYGEKPLKPADTCLETDPPSVSFSDYFRLCITVIAYQPENVRTLEMLIILNSILPCYLEQIKKTRKPSEEVAQISELGVYIRFLLVSVEALTKTINASSSSSQQQQQSQTPLHSTLGKRFSNSRDGNAHANECSVEAGRDKEEAGEKRQPTEEFVAPRDATLQLCSVFYTSATSRINALKGCQSEDILKTKSHVRLAEIANSLLRLLTDESVPTVSIGLAFYVKHVLPIVDWSVEDARPALFIVLKRLDRFFGKISKGYSFRKGSDLRTISMVVSGLCRLLARQPVVAHIPHLKTFVSAAITMQVGTTDLSSSTESSQCQCNARTNISTILSPNLMKLIVLQIQGGGEGSKLQELLSLHTWNDKPEYVLLNLIIPLCLSTAAEMPLENLSERERQEYKISMTLSYQDVKYLLDFCTNVLTGKKLPNVENICAHIATSSPMTKRLCEFTYNVTYLALRVIIVCFHKQLQHGWHELSHALRDIILQHISGTAVWKFITFLMRYKTPLLVYLRPYVERQFLQREIRCIEGMEQRQILEDLLKTKKHQSIRLSVMINELVQDARELRRQLANKGGRRTSSTSKVSFSLPKSPNISSGFFDNERSRQNSFRKAVTPTDSPEVVIKFVTEDGNTRIGPRPSAPGSRIRSRKNFRNLENSSSKEIAQQSANKGTDGLRNSRTFSVGTWRHPNSPPPSISIIPDITVDGCDSPKSSPANPRPHRFGNDGSHRSAGSFHAQRLPPAKESAGERNRRVTVATTTELRSKSACLFDPRQLFESPNKLPGEVVSSRNDIIQEHKDSEPDDDSSNSA